MPCVENNILHIHSAKQMTYLNITQIPANGQKKDNNRKLETPEQLPHKGIEGFQWISAKEFTCQFRGMTDSSLVQEDLTCQGAAKPRCKTSELCALGAGAETAEPVCCNC